jgi:hypothetical protein
MTGTREEWPAARLGLLKEEKELARRSTHFNAPRGAQGASARAAAVISESIGIPSHL